jgi:hypothetical protein
MTCPCARICSASPARHRAPPFGRFQHLGVYDQSLAVFHQQITVSQLRFLALTFACHLRIRSIVDACVSFDRFSPWKSTVSHCQDRQWNGVLSTLALITLRLVDASSSVPSTVKCSSESRLRWACWSTVGRRLRQCPHRALAILGEHGTPQMVSSIQAHEPAEHQVIVEPLLQQPFAAHQYTACSRSARNKFLRRSPGLDIQLAKPCCKSFKASSVMPQSARAKVGLRVLPVRAYITEHIHLLLIFSAHAIFISSRSGNNRFLVRGSFLKA